MPKHLLYSSSSTSRVTSKSLIRSPAKRKVRTPTKTPTVKTLEQLVYITDATLDYQLDTSTDVLNALDHIVDNLWEDFPQAGVSKKLMLEVAALRRGIPKAATVHQLYTVFRDQTYVDRELQRAFADNTIKRIRVNSDNEFLIRTAHYDAVLQEGLRKDISLETRTLLEQFSHLMNAYNFVSIEREKMQAHGFTPPQLSKLVDLGFLTLFQTSTDSTSVVYSLSLPNIGLLLKVLMHARKWLAKSITIHNRSWKEITDTQLAARWESSKAKWSGFKGIRMTWVLYDCLGAGTLEVFRTPVGVAWKLTGKV
ncbi:hypothetical protein BABINDRAFT_159067 [Babjeviella inositovora NRRL Y-12698]|uniref:Serine/threonine-protein kinase 19 n=1 Tax=Babjeviella inositovora NRRL Y-12698 TaxID=984486 RepID=A0A1E3QXT9_9ASCO|nr:uncharacterized protein BABINDRAFT_159067 [Babjeviella inositovora NRRL Y-12698]ODQ82489.1 hypothetical protein BABINDRAFT_159067 [Babjeviella inositovora NRRL Y-12698]